MSFREWNERSCRLANALLGLGLAKGDRVAILAYNCVEWAEIYAATAKAGLIAVPINFRLVGAEVRFIVENCGGHGPDRRRTSCWASSRRSAPTCRSRPATSIHFGRGACPAGYRAYEDLIAAASDSEPEQQVAPADPWTLMYTSGTTGKPKGVVRSHKAAVLLSLVTEIELGAPPRGRGTAGHADVPRQLAQLLRRVRLLRRRDNDLFAQELRSRALRCGRSAEGGSTFTSLVPTHYIMMLGLPAAVRARLELGRVTKLMISSAPARPDTKRAVMEMFPQLRPVRALRLDRGRLGHDAPPARAVHQAGLGRARVRRLGPDQAAGRGRQRGPGRRARRALLLQSLHLRRLLEAAGEDRGRRSAATTARSATWPAATPTATSTSSTARAT